MYGPWGDECPALALSGWYVLVCRVIGLCVTVMWLMCNVVLGGFVRVFIIILNFSLYFKLLIMEVPSRSTWGVDIAPAVGRPTVGESGRKLVDTEN